MLRLVALAVVTALVVVFVALYFLAGQPFTNPFRGGDFDAYWNAAERLRHGAALYPPGSDAGLGFVYRYAPWFAMAFVPLTFFPREGVLLVWQLAMLAAGLGLIWPLVSRPSQASLLLAALMLPLAVDLAWVGNVEALMLLAISTTIRRPVAGPIAVGVAASMKITPIAFAAYFLARGSLRGALIAAIVAVLLWLPALPLGLRDYPTAALPTIALWGWNFAVGAAVAIGSTLLTLALAIRRSRWTALAAAVTSLAASPVLFITSLPRLAVPIWADERR